MNFSSEILDQLSNDDLKALSENNYDNISNEGLKLLSGESHQQEFLRNAQGDSSRLPNSFWDVQKRELKGLAQGVADLGTDLGNLSIRASNGLGHLINPHFQETQWRVPRAPILSPEEENTTEAKVGKFMGEVVPSLFIPQARIAQGLAKGGKAINAMGNFFARNTPRVIDSGINSGIQNTVFSASDDQKSLPQSFATGALIGSGLHAAVGAPMGLAENYFKYLAGKAGKTIGQLRTPQQVSNLHSKLEGAPASIWDVVNASSQRPIENFFKAMPFSGVQRHAEELESATQKQVDNIRQQLLNNAHPDRVQEDLLSALKRNRQLYQNEAGEKFNALNDKAEKVGIKIEPKAIRSSANDLLENHEKALFPQLSSPIRRALTKLKNNPSYQPTFTELHFAHADLDELRRELERKGSYREASQLVKLQNSVHEDMEEALKKYSEPELMREWLEARKYFKEHVVPYRHRYFYNILDKRKQTNLLSNKLLSDEHEGVFNHLSPREKSKLAYLYLSKYSRRTPDEIEHFEPARLADVYQKLDPKIRGKLFTPDQQQHFDKLLALTSVMPKKTLQHQNLNLWRTREMGGLGYLLGGGKLMTPFALGANLLANRQILKYLYSPKAREAYIRQQVSNPKLNAQIARYTSTPFNYFTTEESQ